MSYILNAVSPSDVANWARQKNIPKMPTGLGFLAGRPNQAIEHGAYNVLALQPNVHLSSLGEFTVNTQLLIGGVALLAVGLFLLNRRSPKRRIRRRLRRVLRGK